MLNQIYRNLELKCMELVSVLQHRIFKIKTGFYNGNYHRGEEGAYTMDYYPIPVIEVRGYCDVEIELDHIAISTKLRKETALDYSFEKVKKYPFEAYGVEDYLADYYHPGQPVEALKENIRKSDEREIGFSFYFDFDVEKEKIFEFVKLLRREGFYY